jgi:hypothetical protein
LAPEYFEHWAALAAQSLRTFELQSNEGQTTTWRNDAAFTLHQATERLYICYLLVRTHYFPRSHNIKFLRSLAEDNEPRLIEAWPRSTKLERRRFELLKRAYVEARYSANYEIGSDDLDALMQSVCSLRELVEQLSRERLETLEKAA